MRSGEAKQNLYSIKITVDSDGKEHFIEIISTVLLSSLICVMLVILCRPSHLLMEHSEISSGLTDDPCMMTNQHGYGRVHSE